MNELTAAIAYFEDAVKESDEIIADCSLDLQAELTTQKRHFVVALDALCRAEPANEPLTLEQLREMDGEPIWIVTQNLEAWEILRSCGEGYDADLCHFGEITPLKISEYGVMWLAYLRKPEGRENDG